MSQVKKDPIISCKECGWNIPLELINDMFKHTTSVYCEKCGAQIIKSDYPKLREAGNYESFLLKSRKIIGNRSKKLYGSLKSRWKEYKETKE